MTLLIEDISIIKYPQLGELLKKYYNDNPNIFKDGKPNLKTNFRRFVKIYDWLKYYK